MKILNVHTLSKKYPIFIGNNILSKFHSLQGKLLKKTKKVLVVTSKNIPSKYTLELKRKITNAKVFSISLPDGERIKSDKYLFQITNILSKNNFSREDCLIALGGGVIGDLSGFAASIYKRGINFVQIPTTLLSQVDSSVGGKTGINNQFGKNLIGTFYQPSFVLIDSQTLKTLPYREMVAGFAEILKYALILDKKFFKWLEKNGEGILKRKNFKIIEQAIYQSCRHKAFVVKKDEKEKNIRAILNFGHTFAHALETVTNYSKTIIHGEAVLIGMVVASRLSNQLGYLPSVELKKIINLYNQLNLKFSYNKIIKNKNLKKVFTIMNNDKKSDGKNIKIILLKKIGSFIIKETTLKKSFIPLIEKDLKNGIY